MFKNLLTTIALAGFVIGMTCSVGCSSPGDMVGGSEDAKFPEKSGEKDSKGRESPNGALGPVG